MNAEGLNILVNIQRKLSGQQVPPGNGRSGKPKRPSKEALRIRHRMREAVRRERERCLAVIEGAALGTDDQWACLGPDTIATLLEIAKTIREGA